MAISEMVSKSLDGKNASKKSVAVLKKQLNKLLKDKKGK
jgi:hypothetical protein